MSTRPNYRPRAVRIASEATAPGIYPALKAGQCADCAALGGWLCRSCQVDNAKSERARMETLRRVVAISRATRIAELCADHEIESDDGGTREDKAARILGAESFADYVNGPHRGWVTTA